MTDSQINEADAATAAEVQHPQESNIVSDSWQQMVQAVLGVVMLLVTYGMKLHSGIFMTGNPLLLLSAMLELVGVQFISIGLLGEMLTRTYFESQGKTPYAVRNTVNLDAPVQRRAA